MQLIAVTRLLDEADLVEAFVRHTAAYVDHHILLDNGSRDGSLEILARLRREGLALSVISNPSVTFAEAEANTFLYHLARTGHGAHWVAFLDADEFIDDRPLPGGLRAHLEETLVFRPLVSQIKLRLTDYISIHADNPADPLVVRRIAWRGEPGDNLKTIVRAAPELDAVGIRPGSHGAWWPATGFELWDDPVEPRVTLAHYPERSTWQWMSKFVRGWAKVLAAGETTAAQGNSAHYREAFEILRDRPNEILHNHYLMTFKNERPGLIHDPIDYRGGELAYTHGSDEQLRAVRTAIAYLEALATRHGRLLDACPEARRLSEAWDRDRALLD